jgi:predicted dehydrogenase
MNGRGSGLASGFCRSENCAVAYVCDVDQRAVDKAVRLVADAQGTSPSGVKDFRRILDDPSVDALVIATPDHWHGPATILACAAGKHVYVEKPACHNGREGDLMIAAAAKHGRVIQLGTQRRSSPSVQEAIRRLHDGQIGRVLFARGWITSIRENIGKGMPAEVPSWLDYELWQGPAPDRPYKDNLIHYRWHWFWHWGTGELGNNGIHALDVCRWGLGVDYPSRITGGGGKLFFDDDQETPDTQLATFHFGSPGEERVITWEHRTWNPRGLEESSFGTAFHGDQGTMILTDRACITCDRDGKEQSRTPLKSGESEHLADFLSAIRDGHRPNAHIETGVASTALCHLGNIAYRTGQTVHFDPVAHQVMGDAQSIALWGREYRAGWEPKV